jgi:hypothetical protein
LIVLDLGENPWKCECGIVEALNWLSDRRKSRGLEGEHKHVKCVEGGVYSEIWTAENKSYYCMNGSRRISGTMISTVSSKALEPEEIKEDSPTEGG